MRIAMVSATFLPSVGGVEWKVYYLAQEYALRGHEVAVFTMRPDRDLPEVPVSSPPRYHLVRAGYPIRGAGYLGLNGWLLIRSIVAAHRQKPFDVVHGHQLGNAATWCARVKERTGVPVVVTTSGDDVNVTPRECYGIRLIPRYDRMVRTNVRRVDVIGSVSRGIRAELEAIGTTARIVDIPNGVSWEEFQTGPSRLLRDKLRLGDETVVVLSVGRNFSLKRYDLGIEAFARVIKGADRSAPGDQLSRVKAHYVLIGRELDSLRPLVDRLGVSSHVSFINQMPISELPAAYHSADIFLNPSESEGFAQVNAQALACGLPLVVTDAPGNVDAADHGGALVARCNDVASMAQCLQSLISNPDIRRELGAAAHRASRHYAWSHIAEQYLEVFESLRSARSLGANPNTTRQASMRSRAN